MPAGALEAAPALKAERCPFAWVRGKSHTTITRMIAKALFISPGISSGA
jgi:hypothetical protein